MFKDTTHLELEPYAEADRLIAIVECDALSIRSPGTRSERQEIRATVRRAAVLPAGAELQLAVYAQGAPVMTVGDSYLIAAYRESTGGPWALVEARPSSGADAVGEWEAARAELAPSASRPTASATAPVQWSITYDDLSAFHLDGVFLRYRNDGEYVAQILVRGAKGVDELVFEGHAGVAAGALPATYREALDVELVALPFAQLTSPPPRTLEPDTVVTSLTFVRTEGKATQSTELRYVKGSGKDRLTPAATTLAIAVQKLIAEIQATTPKTVNRNIQTPTKLPR